MRQKSASNLFSWDKDQYSQICLFIMCKLIWIHLAMYFYGIANPDPPLSSFTSSKLVRSPAKLEFVYCAL